MKRFSGITTTQLARICGVSQGTVDRALHDRPGIRPETKEYILSVAREYDYLPHVKGSTGNNSMLIGVVLFDLKNEFFSKLATSLVNEAKRMGYSLIFQFSEKDASRERKALEYFDYIGVDGIVLFSVGSDDDVYEKYLRSIKRPLVSIGNRIFQFPYVGIDDKKAMQEIALRLCNEAKDGELVYYAPILRKPLHTLNAQRLRLQGARAAIKQQNRTLRIAFTPEELSGAAAVICPTDDYAASVLRHLKFPQSLPISGFDNISLLNYLQTPVLTVEYSTDTIARECMNFLLGRPYQPEIPYQLLYKNKETL